MYEFWMRLAYRDLIVSRKITTLVRPGDRRAGKPKGVRVGEKARLRLILRPGSEKKGIPPVLADFEIPARVTAVTVKAIGKITKADLAGSSPDAGNKEAVKCHLGLIYNRSFSDDDEATIIRLEYL
jgi:hypothetical protein